MSSTVVRLEPRRRPAHRAPAEPRPGRVADAGRAVGRFLARAAARALSWALTTALVAGLAAYLGLAVGPHLLDYRTATMLTGSMAPEINPGDVIVSVPKPAEDVEVGDVLTFRAPVEGRPVETHRVVSVSRTPEGRVVVRTKGDANPAADPWRAVIEDDTVWQTVRVIPWVGKAIQELRGPVVRHGLFWVALAGLLLLGVTMIWRRPAAAQAPEPPRAPALDDAALARLARDLEDPAFPAVFAGRYHELLPHRLVRLSSALAEADVDAALDASLSLKVSSSTVGARELHELASVIELSVRREDLAIARAMAGDLGEAGRRADRALAAYLADNRSA